MGIFYGCELNTWKTRREGWGEMGKVVAERKKKKKGRPSLLDLQKRSLQQQQQQQQKQNQQHRNPKPNPNPNPNPNSSTSRRFTRQYHDRSELADDGDDDDRKQKKLKLVLRLPRSFDVQNSNKEDASDYAGGDGGSASASDEDDDDESENGEKPLKKRKINAVSATAGVCNGSADAGSARDKVERQNPTSRTADPLPGTPSESASVTPLPNKKLLLFVLDRLQKKDTYGVFSEPVDPKELPDYHEVIQQPMDFGTVKKKLGGGAYANLEQFEKDVLLISSNAMRYNAPDTIYFRQARSIQELATKDFQNLRQDCEGNELELLRPAPRGRPPKKLSKRPVGRPPLEPAGSDFSSDATPATARDHSAWSNTSYDPMRKIALLDKPGSASGIGDVSTRTSNRLRNGETSSWLAEYKPERNDDVSGSMLRGVHGKYGKKPFVFDENRRGTYKLSNQMSSGRDVVFSTFDGERKQLISVGLHMEFAYARSLARFAANLGPMAWKIASSKIARALPAGTKFGPGWVGESEAPLPSSMPPPPPPLSSTHSQPQISPPPPMLPPTSGSRGDKLLETPESSKNSSPPLTPPTATNRPLPNPTEVAEPAGVLSNSESSSGVNRIKSSFQNAVNGFNGKFSFPSVVHGSSPLPAIRPARPAGQFGSDAMPSSRRPDTSSSFIHPAQAKNLEAEGSAAESEHDRKKSVTSNSLKSGDSNGEYDQELQAGSGTGLRPQQPSWKGLLPHQKPGSVPPDLNVGFQSAGSPVRQTSGVLVDSQLPDLALQL